MQVASQERELDGDLTYYRSLTYSDNTKRTYQSHLRSYLGFCALMRYPPVPVSHLTICRYAAFLAKRLSVASIKKYINIIRILHLEAGLPNPLKETWFLDTVIRGIGRHKGLGTRRKLPINPHILLKIRSLLDLSSSVDAVFWAACLLAFFGFLRKSNLFPPSAAKFDPSKHLLRDDFTLFNWGIMLTIRWSKTIQFGERILRAPIPWLPNHPLCPVQALLGAFSLTQGAPPTGPAFVIIKEGRVSPFPPSKFVSMLRTHLSSLGFQANLFSGHSFRRVPAGHSRTAYRGKL